MIEIIAFDADDTLWHNEINYAETDAKLERLLRSNYGLASIDGEIYRTEKENLRYFGYGVKSYTISMIETAIRLTNGRIEGRHISEITAFGREMLEREVQLLEGAEDVVSELAAEYPLMLVTKGDQFEQERKVDRSGLARYFKHIDIVSEKSIETYDRLLDRYGIHPSRFLMVGNSLRSDIVPVVSLGGQAAYIPYDLTWEHETILAEPLDPDRYHHIERLNLLPGLIRELDSS